MKTAFLLLTSLALCMVAHAESPDSVPDPRKTNRSSIYDGAGVLSGSEENRINEAINALEKKTQAQMMVATVQTLDGQSIEAWSNTLFRRIGIGHKGKDDGVLFVFAIQDHKMRMEVGDGLSDRLTDARTGEIQRDQIRPAFKASNYGQGILDGVNAAANYIEGGSRPASPSTSGSTSSSSAARPPALTPPPGGFYPPSGSAIRVSPPASSSGSSSPGSGTSMSGGSSSGSSGSGGGAFLLIGLLAVGGVGTAAYVMTRPRRCPRCNTAMTQSEADASELNDAQQCERSMGSRSFPKFSCPKCSYSEIDPKDTMFSGVTTCQTCGNKTARTHRRTLSQPSYDFSGEEEVTEECEYPPCRHTNRYTRTLPRLTRSTTSSSSSSSFGSSSSSSSSDSSSSSSSSSYGGGDSSGGGSSSSW